MVIENLRTILKRPSWDVISSKILGHGELLWEFVTLEWLFRHAGKTWRQE